MIQNQLLDIVDRIFNAYSIWEAFTIAISPRTKVLFHDVNNIHGINSMCDIINNIWLEKCL